MKNLTDSKFYSMFKAYDVRAIAGEDGLTKEVYYFAAQALVKEILEKENLPLEVCLMRDARVTSPEFYNYFSAGLESAGAKVISLGLGASDLLYAATVKLQKPGVMITASHNPKAYNGFKIVKKAPQAVGLESGLDKIRDYVINKIDIEKLSVPENINEKPEDTSVKSTVTEYIESKIEEIGSVKYIDNLLKKQEKTLKVVVDAANGMGGLLMENVKRMYSNVEFINLYWEPDGTFPNHAADPMDEKNLVDLKRSIKDSKADLGAMLDGDGDRCVLVDEKGKTILGDYLVATLGEYMVKVAQNNPELGYNPAVVFPGNSSRCTPRAVIEAEGVAVPSKQGHVYIKGDMQRYNAIYGGEGSNHHYFGQFGCMDSGVINLVLSIKLLVEKKQKASELTAKWQNKFFLSGEQNYRLENGLNLQEVVKRLKKRYSQGSISQVDGITITYDNWKLSVRSSNTEPLLRFNVETLSDDSDLNPTKKLDEILKVSGIK